MDADAIGIAPGEGSVLLLNGVAWGDERTEALRAEVSPGCITMSLGDLLMLALKSFGMVAVFGFRVVTWAHRTIEGDVLTELLAISS